MIANKLWTIVFSFIITGASHSITIEPIQVKEIFVPAGFDSNDLNVQIVLAGKLPNTCFRFPSANIIRYGKKIEIDVRAKKLSENDHVCIEALIPYSVPVDLGTLEEGEYEIKVNAFSPHKSSSKKIFIEPAVNTTIDNYNYANVTNVYRDRKNQITLEGYHPNGCMGVKELKVIPNEAKDTFSVLPIITLEGGEICDTSIKPFKITLDLKPEKSTTLLHVRQIYGRAINKILYNNTFEQKNSIIK